MRVIGVILVCALALILPRESGAHNLPGTKHNRQHAIAWGFCGNSSLTRLCSRGAEALRVAECESHLWPYARNGRYLGMFQVSDHWRATVKGWAWNPWAQARHAARVHSLVGWSHWECAYITGIR